MDVKSVLNMIEIFVLLQKIPVEQRLQNRNLYQGERSMNSKSRIVIKELEQKAPEKARNASTRSFNDIDSTSKEGSQENPLFYSINSLENANGSMVDIERQQFLSKNTSSKFLRTPDISPMNSHESQMLSMHNASTVSLASSRETKKEQFSSETPNSSLSRSRIANFLSENKRDDDNLVPVGSGSRVPSPAVSRKGVRLTIKTDQEEFVKRQDPDESSVRTDNDHQQTVNDNNACADFADLVTPINDIQPKESGPGTSDEKIERMNVTNNKVPNNSINGSLLGNTNHIGENRPINSHDPKSTEIIVPTKLIRKQSDQGNDKLASHFASEENPRGDMRNNSPDLLGANRPFFSYKYSHDTYKLEQESLQSRSLNSKRRDNGDRGGDDRGKSSVSSISTLNEVVPKDQIKTYIAGNHDWSSPGTRKGLGVSNNASGDVALNKVPSKQHSDIIMDVSSKHTAKSYFIPLQENEKSGSDDSTRLHQSVSLQECNNSFVQTDNINSSSLFKQNARPQISSSITLDSRKGSYQLSIKNGIKSPPSEDSKSSHNPRKRIAGLPVTKVDSRKRARTKSSSTPFTKLLKLRRARSIRENDRLTVEGKIKSPHLSEQVMKASRKLANIKYGIRTGQKEIYNQNTFASRHRVRLSPTPSDTASVSSITSDTVSTTTLSCEITSSQVDSSDIYYTSSVSDDEETNDSVGALPNIARHMEGQILKMKIPEWYNQTTWDNQIESDNGEENGRRNEKEMMIMARNMIDEERIAETGDRREKLNAPREHGRTIAKLTKENRESREQYRKSTKQRGYCEETKELHEKCCKRQTDLTRGIKSCGHLANEEIETSSRDAWENFLREHINLLEVNPKKLVEDRELSKTQ
ncbi:3246_t:CDS:2, partial [Acaulospora colombiana]